MAKSVHTSNGMTHAEAGTARDDSQGHPPARVVVLNQMAGPMTWELVVDLVDLVGPVQLITGHPDTLAKVAAGMAPPGLSVTPSVPYRRGSLVLRFWSWLRYCLHALGCLATGPRPALVLAFSNPPILVWGLRWLCRIRSVPYAVMVHDIFPDVLEKKGVLTSGGILSRAWRGANRRAYADATMVLTLGEYMRRTLSRQAHAIRIVPPWADTQRLGPWTKSKNPFAQEHQQVDKFTVMYSGNMGWGHDLESLWAAAERLADVPQLHFMFVGSGPKWDWLAEQQRKRPLANVTLLGWQPEDVLPASTATADVAIVSLEPEMTGLAVPSKAFTFLAAHVPLIALCEPASELADLVAQFQCGQALAPGAAGAIEGLLRELADDPQRLSVWRAGAAHASRAHQRSVGTQAFATLLRPYLTTGRAAGSRNAQSQEK